MPPLHEPPAHSRAGLAHQLAGACPGLRCAWWCEGASGVGDFVLARALPTEAVFDALLHNPAADG
jgi:hypothetical protein